MEEKGVRDRKREPEEYNFDYEELADAEVDSEQAGRRDDAVWETTCDTEDPYTVESEDFTEDEDYGEYPEGDDLDDFDEGDGIGFRFRPWMIPAFAGMMVLAVLICIPLWKLSHHDRTTENNEFAAVTTEAQSSEQASAENRDRIGKGGNGGTGDYTNPRDGYSGACGSSDRSTATDTYTGSGSTAAADRGTGGNRSPRYQ